MRGGLLASYHYLREGFSKDPGRTSRHLQAVAGELPVVLDSGAFSAANSGVPIPILEFGRFVRRHGAAYEWVASLDVIGDPDRTLSNWKALRREYPVVPTVHLLTDLRFLDYYLDQGVHRIAMGGMVGNRGISELESPEGQWLQEALDRCVHRGVPVHGFGVTSRTVLDLYPWDSVDSTAAIRNAMFRQVLVLQDGSAGYRKVKPEELPSNEAALLLGDWEVVPNAGRNARIRRNVRIIMKGLATTGTATIYHAITPNGTDERAVVRGIQDYMGKA
jgi:hypothetical protein